MLIAICGSSGAGKTELSKYLSIHNSSKEVVSYTTRSPRVGEKNDVDYHFVSNETFNEMIINNEFCVYEEYSQHRFYGTAKSDIISAAGSDNIYTVVVTPNGMRAIEDTLKESGMLETNYVSVLVTASLGVRVKRYIDRVGSENFNFDDMNEINARVNRDFGMFLNMEKHCDLVLDNSADYRYDTSIVANPMLKLADQIIKEVNYRRANRFASYQEEEEFY